MSAKRIRKIRNVIHATREAWPGDPDRAPWLASYRGPTPDRLVWIAEALRTNPKKAERLALAAALDELARVLEMEHRPAARRGRPMREATWAQLGVVIALVNRHGFARSAAIRAACSGDSRAADALRHALLVYEARGLRAAFPPRCDARALETALHRARLRGRKK